jgi:hypothetical protein
MTPKEAGTELTRLFSGPPQPRGKWRWQHRQYDLVRLDDGTIGFARNALDAEISRAMQAVWPPR